MSTTEYKHILRIAGKDIEGSKKIIIALSQIKGLGYNVSQVILQSLNINSGMRIGFLTEKEVSDIEAAIKNPSLIGIPNWYLNRRKDSDTGSDKHLLTSDLDFTISNDIEREKTVYSWRGYRHMFGLRVRGQCTRTTGRKGGAVGVKKVVMRPSAGTGAGGAEAKEANAPVAESATAGPAASTPKGNTEKSPEAKE
ncbi:MAG TPA: 30S ribosomal protein S13 [Nitrososphaeraceae archaeon]|nr:30S ribosomal protein S13 [Nitrososphaeraceae archaeon]